MTLGMPVSLRLYFCTNVCWLPGSTLHYIQFGTRTSERLVASWDEEARMAYLKNEFLGSSLSSNPIFG